MSAQAALLGIDVGTSGCKAIVVDGSMQVLASQLSEYPLSIPQPGWAEQDPQHWWQAACKAASGALRDAGDVEIKAVGLSGQMHGMVALDSELQVIRPAILWNDQRNARQCEYVTERAGGIDGLLGLTNNRMLPGYTGGKIVWLRDEEPASYERLRHVVNPKDYVRLRLTGQLATEVSDASGTGLFDVRARRWCTRLIEAIDLDPQLFAPAVESDALTGQVTAEAAGQLGLPAGVPVVGGGGDAVIQTTGSGIVSPGSLQLTIGTAGIAACALDKPVDNPHGSLQIFCGNSAALWHCMGVSMNAGGALAWLRRLLAGMAGRKPEAISYAELMEMAGQAAPGAGGLLFLPYLQGERCPHSDPDARGAFIGLNLRHEPRDLVRAVLEGVVFSLAAMYRLFEQLGVSSTRVVTSGGGSASRLWRGIQADVFDAEVVTVSGAAEGGAFGAAMVAGVSAGIWADLGQAAGLIAIETTVEPNRGASDLYKEVLASYLEIYPSLAPTFKSLARQQGGAAAGAGNAG